VSNMKLVSARELAEFLDLSVDTIWRYTRKKITSYI
jgi:predicted DNA-binding transcriptional regulator AlpA